MIARKLNFIVMFVILLAPTQLATAQLAPNLPDIKLQCTVDNGRDKYPVRITISKSENLCIRSLDRAKFDPAKSCRLENNILVIQSDFGVDRIDLNTLQIIGDFGFPVAPYKGKCERG